MLWHDHGLRISMLVQTGILTLDGVSSCCILLQFPTGIFILAKMVLKSRMVAPLTRHFLSTITAAAACLQLAYIT